MLSQPLEQHLAHNRHQADGSRRDEGRKDRGNSLLHTGHLWASFFVTEAEPPLAGPSPAGAVSLCLLPVSPLGLNPLKAATAPPASRPRPRPPRDPAHRRCPCISAATTAGGDRPAAAGTGLSGSSHPSGVPGGGGPPLLMCFAYALHKHYPWWEFKDLSPPLLELEVWCSQRKGLLCIPRWEGAGGQGEGPQGNLLPGAGQGLPCQPEGRGPMQGPGELGESRRPPLLMLGLGRWAQRRLAPAPHRAGP